MNQSKRSGPKDTSASLVLKEELICADSVKLSTDPEICEVTGSAAELVVVSSDQKLNIHITDVAFVKLFQKMALSPLVNQKGLK